MTRNNYHKMKFRKIKSSGNSKEFHETLKKRNNLLKKDYGCNGIIISAPHHSPKGLENIAGGTRPADNNTGYVARNIADHCKGQLVIATRATEDPNKTEGTFHKHTVGKSPNVYVEIHGHVSANYDIEISCGAESHTEHSEKLAGKVKQYLANIATNVEMSKPEMAERLRNLTVCGNYEDIKMKANGTKTITDARNVFFEPTQYMNSYMPQI